MKSYATDTFNCLNRMDKKDEIFSKKVFPIKPKGKKLSILLNYTKDYFVCNGNYTFDWSYETLKNVSVIYTTFPSQFKLYQLFFIFITDNNGIFHL